MFSDIKTSKDLFQRVRYSMTKQEDTAEWEKKKVYIYNYINDGIDGCRLEEGGEQVHSPPAAYKSPARSAKLCKMVLWILMLGVIITLAIYFPLEIIKVKKSINHLQTLGKWCPDGWTRFGCSCYCKYKETKSWYESRKHCQERGADLVIIDSPDEQEFVKTLNENGESWIGLQRTRIKDMWMYGWRWVDGSLLTQTYWAAGWPQNTSYETHATCCNDEGKWTHRYYNNSYNYYYNNWICEK